VPALQAPWRKLSASVVDSPWNGGASLKHSEAPWHSAASEPWSSPWNSPWSSSERAAAVEQPWSSSGVLDAAWRSAKQQPWSQPWSQPWTASSTQWADKGNVQTAPWRSSEQSAAGVQPWCRGISVASTPWARDSSAQQQQQDSSIWLVLGLRVLCVAVVLFGVSSKRQSKSA
jgi:hypothetical protein